MMTEGVAALIGETAPAAPDFISSATAPAAPPLVLRHVGMPQADTPDQILAKEELRPLYSDRDFYKALTDEYERGVAGPATQRYKELNARKGGAVPTGAVVSQKDVRAQEAARHDDAWSRQLAYAASKGVQYTPEQETEFRGGVVHRSVRDKAINDLRRMREDVAFVSRHKAGDCAAVAEWTDAQIKASLRPVDYSTKPIPR
jgi:hypothetical protein